MQTFAQFLHDLSVQKLLIVENICREEPTKDPYFFTPDGSSGGAYRHK